MSKLVVTEIDATIIGGGLGDKTNAAFVIANSGFTKANNSYLIANVAFDKANSANVLAYNTGIGANNYSGAMANSVNSYAATVGTSTNNYTSATYSTLTQFGSVFGVANAAFGFANGVSTNTTAAFAKANTALQNTTGTFEGTLTTTGGITVGSDLSIKKVSETPVALGSSGTSKAIDLGTGTVFTSTLTGDCTFTLSNVTSAKAASFSLILTNDGTPSRSVAWSGGSFKYPSGSLTRTTTALAVDIWTGFTPDGGTTWYLNIPMKNIS